MNEKEIAKNLLLDRRCSNCIYQTFQGKPIMMRCLLDDPIDFSKNNNDICDSFCHEDISLNINFHVQTQFMNIVNMEELEYFKGFVNQYKHTYI